MSMSDPIADLLTRIRNGLAVNKHSVSMLASRVKEAIATVLKNEGYIEDVTVTEEGNKKQMTIQLRYHEGHSAIEKIARVSRPGCRVYCSASDMPQIHGGLGVAMVSTSKGILTDRQARSAGVGGEVICTVC